MLSRAKQCNVLWSHVEQQRPAAGDPSSSSCPHGGAAAPARAGVLPARYKFDKCKPLYAPFKGIDTFSLWSQLFSSFSVTLSRRRTEAAAPWGADAAGPGSSSVAAAGPSQARTRAVSSVAFIPGYTPHTLEEKQNFDPALSLSREKASGS